MICFGLIGKASKILVILIKQNKSWVFSGWKTLFLNEYKYTNGILLIY